MFIDRTRANRPFHSGKRKKNGMNLQAIVSPGSAIVWVASSSPGSTHHVKTARKEAGLRG